MSLSGSGETILPNVLANSLGWASFMFVSTNQLYQLVIGIEQVMYKAVPALVGCVGLLVLHTGNNVIGWATWVMWHVTLASKRRPQSRPAQLHACSRVRQNVD
eukprot:724564-Rhodomonas_salina.1